MRSIVSPHNEIDEILYESTTAQETVLKNPKLDPLNPYKVY